MNDETVATPAEEPTQDRSILDKILNKSETPAVEYVFGNCPNCANNGTTSVLDNFVCGKCDFTIPVNQRPIEEVPSV